MSRVDACRKLQLVIAQLGDGLLDQAAIDRVKSITFGAIKREAERTLEKQRFAASQLRFEERAA